MRLDVHLLGARENDRNDEPTLLVQATIQEGDSVTPGSQYNQVFTVEELRQELAENDEFESLADEDEDEEDEAAEEAAENEGLHVEE